MSVLAFVGRALRAAVWVLIAVGFVLFGWIWLISDQSGQEKMMMTVPLLLLTGVLAVAALVTVRGAWRRPARVVAALLVAIGLAVPVLFRLKGLTGDFYPVLEYRFAPKHDTTLAVLPGAALGVPSEPVSPADDTIAKTRRREGAKDDVGPVEPGTPAPGTRSTQHSSTQHSGTEHSSTRHSGTRHISEAELPPVPRPRSRRRHP